MSIKLYFFYYGSSFQWCRLASQKKIKKLKLKKIGYQLGSKVGVWVIFESLSCSLLCYLNRRFLPLYMKSCCSRYCSFLFFKKKCEAPPKNFGPNFYCSLLCSICYLLLWGHSVLCPINKLKSITIFWLCDYDKNLLMVSNYVNLLQVKAKIKLFTSSIFLALNKD